MSGIGAYAGAARRSVHFVTALSPSVCPSPRQIPGPPRPYPSDRTPPDATMKPVDALSAWSGHSDLDEEEFDERDLRRQSRQARHSLRSRHATDLSQASFPEYQVVRHILMPPVAKDSAKRHSTKKVQMLYSFLNFHGSRQ